MWAYALSLCSHMTTTHPNLWNYEHKPLYDYLNIHPPAGHTNVSEREQQHQCPNESVKKSA